MKNIVNRFGTVQVWLRPAAATHPGHPCARRTLVHAFLLRSHLFRSRLVDIGTFTLAEDQAASGAVSTTDTSYQ